jgi:hypothetical protein
MLPWKIENGRAIFNIIVEYVYESKSYRGLFGYGVAAVYHGR